MRILGKWLKSQLLRAGSPSVEKAKPPLMEPNKSKLIVKGVPVCYSTDRRWMSLPAEIPDGWREVWRGVTVDHFALIRIERYDERGIIEMQEWVLKPIGTDPENPITTTRAVGLLALQKWERRLA